MSDVTIELEWEQIDAIVCKQLKESIEYMFDSNGEPHPDYRHDKQLLDALFVVYHFFAGWPAFNKLKETFAYEKLPE